MKTPQKTREQILIELAEGNQLITKARENDERRRKEFAKAFNWYKKGRYDSESEPTIPSWEEIFVQVGKLLREKDNLDIIAKMQELQAYFDAAIEVFNQKKEENERRPVGSEDYFKR